MADAVATATSVVGEKAAVISAYITSLPFADDVAKYYGQFLGTTSTSEFYTELLPILYVALMPLLCALCACVGLCSDRKKGTMGTRVLKRINHAIRADIRLVNAISPKKGKGGITSLSDIEKGRTGKGSPIKNKAAVRDVARDHSALARACTRERARRTINVDGAWGGRHAVARHEGGRGGSEPAGGAGSGRLHGQRGDTAAAGCLAGGGGEDGS